jgi:glycosyltransferase involved in cell wall biosynthesis
MAIATLQEQRLADQQTMSVTIVVPAYNEGPALEAHLRELTQAFDAVNEFGAIDYIVVDDGSTDETHDAAMRVAQTRNDMVIVRHDVNRGLGAALRTAGAQASGELVLTVDSDLSYSTQVLVELLRTACSHNADVVMASAYMKGGKVRDVPLMRAVLSREANRFLSLATGGSFATLTCMVRVYRREFLNRLSFNVDGMDVNAQLAFQAIRAGGNLVEIPATLQWPQQRRRNAGRASLPKITKLTWRTLKCGLAYRPALVLGIPGLIPGLLPAVVAAMLAFRLSPRAIAIGTAITLVVQYGSLAILGGQALSFLRRRRRASKNAPADLSRPHFS